jgi:hypothetical protein
MANRPPAPNAPRGGAIEALAASPVRRGIIWAGTNNGLIKVTKDEGRTWQDATIADLPDSSQSDISMISASHHDPAEAYVAVDAHTTGDYAPLIYRTRDYGASWTKIVTGLPTGQSSGSFARMVLEDDRRAGLLFAGTESGMYVSFDDGDDWQSVQLNFPNTSVRDAAVVGNDLVVGTYGRGIWILDDISPLRQMTTDIAAEPAHLFAPGGAVRVHRNTNQDTPFPPEVPHALNPPEGAIIYYSLGARPAGEVTIDVLDAGGSVVRHLSSVASQPVPEAARPPEPDFWHATPQPLSTAAGVNRANWDLRYDPPPAFTHSFEINANPGLTPASPEGPLVRPGSYTVRLTVDGKSYTGTERVVNDPRSRASAADLAAQSDMQVRIYRGMAVTWDGYQQATALRAALASDTAAGAAAEARAAAAGLLARIDTVAGNAAPRAGGFGGGGRRGGPVAPNFVALNGAFGRQLNGQDLADQAPTEAALAAFTGSCEDLKKAVTSWNDIRDRGVAALNAALTGRGPAVTATGGALLMPDCGAPAPARRSPVRRAAR